MKLHSELQLDLGSMIDWDLVSGDRVPTSVPSLLLVQDVSSMTISRRDG